ncbi:hypothetical protein CE91St1_54600 [Parabacteroides goldsteinii]|uniref:hypothetical protein n=1 Tax=Parabacteroides TaxID=375288 RepID=UPI001FBA2D93|nr:MULTISPECIES: hypothetical protein [Parabacteroides]MCM0719225.1 hypothetical protein [Parabacteroides sp. W1-Q-101]GKG76317.1 hypothetical protein CE91St1_54600 [Parabacteroides goldsteinii]GKG80275.1 hypothetical protein CE91St2_34670 [Parabacteroides goldsteinii]
MKGRLNPYRNLSAVVCLLAFLAFGCVSGEKGGSGDLDLPEMVEVDLQVGIADVMSPLQTKADEGEEVEKKDDNALSGEQIHSLAVLIVNNSTQKIEKKFLPDLTNDEKAKEGELTSWTSEEFRLPQGTKRIYAFANWESLKNEMLNAVIAAEEGDEIPKLPEEVSWPEGGFDPKQKKVYLPMSYAETWEVSSSVKKRIELTRLVSRLQVKVTNATNHGLKLDGLTLGSFNNKTLLLGGSIKDWSGKGDVDFLPAETKTLQPMGDKLDEYTSGWMYVFESSMQNGFKLDFKTTSQDNVYHGSGMHSGIRFTENTEVKRNHIWNLNLWVCGYSLTLTLKGENPPIGGYPVLTSKLEGLNGTLYGGGPFTIEIIELKSLNEGTPVPENIQWSIDRSIENPEWLIEDLQLAGTTITGRMAGYAINATGPLTFKLKATSGVRTISVFPVTLNFAEIFEQAQSQP